MAHVPPYSLCFRGCQLEMSVWSSCLSSRLSSAKPSAPVIMDGKRLSEDEDDEDEQFLVEEAVPPPSDAPEMEVVSDLEHWVVQMPWENIE